MPTVNIGGAANDGTGDPLRSAFGKLNTAIDLVNELITAVRANGGKIFATREDAFLFGQENLPGTLGRILTANGDFLELRGNGNNTNDPLFETYPYWGVLERYPRRALLANGLRDYGIIPLINIGGSGDAIVAELGSLLVTAGVTALGTSSEVEYIPTQTNAAANPTFMIGAQTFGIRNADGGTWPAGGFVVGRSYKLSRRNTVLRVSSGDSTSVDLVAETTARTAADAAQRAELLSAIDAAVSTSVSTALALAREPVANAPGDDLVLVDSPDGPAVLVRPDGTLRATILAEDVQGLERSLTAPAAPGDYIVALVDDLAGNIVLGIDVRDGSLWPAGAGGSGGSTVEFVDPDNQGDAWNSIQTTDDHGEVIRYLSRQWRETWGYEKRGEITLAQSPDPAIGIVAFGGGSSAVARPIPDGFPFHVVDQALVHPEDGQAASAAAAAWLEGEYSARRGLPTVVALTQVVGSTVEADALAGSAPREALKAKVVAARSALGAWGKDFFVDRIGLALLEGAPSTLQATADLHYAAVANSMRAEIADAAGQIPMPVVVVSQSAGTRTDGTSEVILAEGNLEWAHWSLGLIVATPKYPFPLQAGSPATLTPEGAMQVSELEALAVTERLAARDWYGPTIGAQCTRAGAVITVPFTAMSALVIRDPANHGFAVDGVTNGATIASVAVSGTNVLITMSAAPAGTLTVRYAFGRTGDQGDGYPANRGSLTDSWSQPSRMVSGATLYRYARSGRAPVV